MTVNELYEKLNSPAFQDTKNGDMFYNFFIVMIFYCILSSERKLFHSLPPVLAPFKGLSMFL